MDDLERQMEHLRDQMQRTLGGAEGAGRRTALQRLRSFFPGRVAPGETGGSSKDARDSAEWFAPAPTDAGGRSQEAVEAPEERSRWRRMFGG